MIAMAALFLVVLLAVSLSFGQTTQTASATVEYGQKPDSEYVKVRNGAASGFKQYSATEQAACIPQGNIVRTADELCYVFFYATSGTYTLGANFKIIDNSWTNAAGVLKCTLNGAGYEIWNEASVNTAETPSSDYLGGLAGVNQGTITNLTYYFSGGIYGKKAAAAAYLAVGGMFGVNNGTISNCNIDVAGAIETEGNASGVTSYVGGMIGYMGSGNVTNCEIISTGMINAYNDKESNEDSDNNIVYAGGVVGRMGGGNLTLNRIKSTSSVLAGDNTVLSSSYLDAIGDLLQSVGSYLGITDPPEPDNNGPAYIHPAGGVVGGITGNAKISQNEIAAGGSSISYGTSGAANTGSIAGGFIGEISSSGNTTVQSNSVKLQCSLSAFMIPTTDLVNMAKDALLSAFSTTGTKTVYLGAVVGRCDASSITFTNNYFAVEKDNGIIEDGADFSDDADYKCKTGLLCGNDKLANLLGNNNWMARRLSECDTGRVADNTQQVDCKLHHLIIFGDGEVNIQGGHIVTQANMTVEAKPICSPFYGWTNQIGAASPSFTTAKTKELTNSMSKVLFAVFIDTKIESSGELTQLAKDINQIKLRAYKNLGNSDSKDEDGNPLMYFSGATSPTLSWLSVDLEKDILVRDGTPVIEEFSGTFNGQGHTISFASGSKIMHDFEQEADVKDEFSKKDDPEKDITDFSECSTGLFGKIKAGGVVSNLKILFGGTIDVSDGLTYKEPDKVGDKLTEKKRHVTADDFYNKAPADGGDPLSIYNNNFPMASFTFPTYDSFEEVHFYALTGDGYVADRDYNPGYVEAVPNKVDIIVYTAYVGILAGENYGTITNVEVEATKSAFVLAAGKTVYFGTLCGYNAGALESVSATMNGKVTLRVRETGAAGGMIGTNQASSGALYNGLNAYVGGEINVERALNYYAITIYMYNHAKFVDQTKTVDDGYDLIALDTEDGDSWDDALEDAFDVFEVSGLMGTKSYRLFGNGSSVNDQTTITEMIGTLVGLYMGSASTFANTAAVAGAKGTFNTPVYNVDSSTSYIGAMVGRIAANVGIPTFQNAWAVMSYEEYIKDVSVRRRPIASVSVGVETGINVVYVQKTVAVANVDINTTLPVSFTLAAQEGMTFSGWYDYTSGERTVITEGLQGTVFTPQNQLKANQVYVAELLSLQLFSEEELRVLSASTNEGRGYAKVEFTLGADISVSNFIPIGTEQHPFLGTLTGNGLAVTINSNATGSLAGLFGCIGSTGVVKNLIVRIAADIGTNDTQYAGAVAAINNGVIGQDISTGKVIVEILGKIKGKNAGGIVGVNHSVVKNAEVYFKYSSEFVYGQVEATASSGTAYGGGAIGYNQYVNVATTAKNIIVYFDNTTENTPLAGKTNTYAVGGVIGENGNGATAYSLVSVFNYATIFGEDFPGSSGKLSKFRGLIIGHNASQNNVDSLWALCLSKSKTSSVEYDPELGAPLSVYQGNEEDVSTSQAVLLNGEDFRTGNILIKYGWGDVEVSISGAESAKGGQITFHASKLSRLNNNGNETVPEEKRVSFYDYVASFKTGDKVPVSEGNTGLSFSPTVGTASASGLSGKVYYAGFCNTTIASQTDYNAVAANIANDYRLYVIYNVNASFVLDESAAASIGSAEKPFVGCINGNANTVTMNSPSSVNAFVGVLGENGATGTASIIKNLRLEIRSGSFMTSTAGEAKGFLTNVNYGTISGVNLVVHGYLKNNGAAGSVAGINYGNIESAIVTLEYAKAFGTPGFGAIFGETVGAVVGVNYGELGNSMPNSIDVTIKREASYRGMLYATGAVGGVAGSNAEGGVIRSAIVTLSGLIVGNNASVLVGENAGQVESALVTIESGAVYAGTNAFGAIAGSNSGLIGHTDPSAANYEKVIKSYIYESPLTGSAIDVTLGDTTIFTIPATSTKAVGGIVGVNQSAGTANAMVVESHASLIASEKAGLLAGANEGLLQSATLTSSVGANVIADISGGIVGLNGGTIDRVVATLRGAVGSAAVGENGVVHSSIAGGVFGKNVHAGESVTNTAVALYADVYGLSVGLGAGEGNNACAVNTWAQICNSSVTPVIGNQSLDPDEQILTGFNVIRVLNETLLNVIINEKTGRLSFGSAISGVKKWYTDISGWTTDSGFISSLTGKLKYNADGMERNVVYYVCYDNLEISNRTDFNALATKINSHSYYNNVLFRLGDDIMVESGAVIRPIGTEEYPFNGIFDGYFHAVTLQEGSALSGPRYAGLFGYTAPNAVIKNLLYTVEKGVSIGSVNSYVIGSLVGYNQGVIKNVFVNLSINLTYNSQREFAGGLIGQQASIAPAVENVWISALNCKDPVVGNTVNDNQFGVNYLGVLGNGMTEMQLQGSISDLQQASLLGDVEVSVKYYVPTEEDGNAADQARCQEYFDSFGGWYNDIRNENSLIKVTNISGLGDFSGNPGEKKVWLITDVEAIDQKVTLSFISLTIKNEVDFIRFAQNIKNYGDQGAVFKLEADIVVNFNNCLSVGTPEHPFTGTFEGNGHVITVTGSLIKREYAGVFGYVGTRGLIKNLAIEVGAGVRFGDNDSLYSGAAVALLYGSLQSVVVRVHADTVIYTTQGRPSSGGIVGRAGKLDDDSNVVYDYSIDNCWLIVEENATVLDAMGREEGSAFESFYAQNGVGRIMRMVGTVATEDNQYESNPFKKGALKVSIDPTNGNILFDATEGGSVFYGFIDNTTADEQKMVPISDLTTNIYRWTVRPGNVYGTDTPTSEDMLCVFINKFINTTEEFLQISENVRLGRNYRGIIYELGADIVISADDLPDGIYSPIGGEVKVDSGAGYESFVERDFIGGFYGNGHTISVLDDVVIDARYAGLFGRVGADARIKDFILSMNCVIGKDNAENTVRTIYAGTLAAYAVGGKYDNIVVVLEKNASLFGSVGTGRAFGYLPKDLLSDVATNCWAISYNSKANYELNESEIAFNNGGEGVNQGGFNSLMVIAAGVVTVNRNGTSYYFTYSDPNAGPGSSAPNPYWYDRYVDEALGEYWHTETDYSGSGWDSTFKNNGYYPTGLESRRVYNVSFLNSRISTYEDLQKYARNVNEGYNFYKLTFTLESDIAIENGFEAIGTATSGMNGTFNGNKHTITLSKNVVIEGEYAGIFGYISEDGAVENLRIVIAGTLGKNSYTQEQIDTYHVVNTRYAGAVAYNNGSLRNVVVVSEGATLRTLQGISGLVIAYDATNLSDNVWALVDASSYVEAVGECAVGDTRVNMMTIIGIGEVDADFDVSSYQVKFTSDGEIPVMGWYKSFEKNQQISKAMLSSGDLANGLSGYLIAPLDYSGVKYEVAVIKTTVTTVAEMIAIAEDVNVGGYSFENITFNLGADIAIPGENTAQGYLSIGTEEHRFKGTFTGKDYLTYHTITVSSGYILEGVFGYNAGTISDLTVLVKGTIGKISGNSDNVYGVVACVNAGTILRAYVEVQEGGAVTGYTVGGIAGNNLGTISDCVVVVKEGGVIKAETNRRNVINVGAVAGINYGTVEGASDFTYWNARALLPTDDDRIARLGEGAEANVFIYGTVSAKSTAAVGSSAAANAGGAVGNQNDGFINYMIVYLADSGRVESSSADAGMARAGGLVGYAKASVNHSVTFLYGGVSAKDHMGGTAGYLEGVIAMNVWQVTLNRIIDGAGEGAKSVNTLNIKGNGKVKATIDLFGKRIVFTNVTELTGSKIDGWYTAASVEVDDKTGNVGENGNTFLPLGTIQNKYVMVIFVNTKIYSAADLNDMASSVSGGLAGTTIVFTLMNDITIEAGDLTELIGTVEFPFNNVFDGMGHKITLKGGSLAGTDYVGLFGYTGATAIIRNLTVEAEAGVYGSATSERTAILVAYHEGSIGGESASEKVTLILDEGAELFGQTVGALVATSFGAVQNVELTLAGRLVAAAENTAIAGGVVGANEGTIENVKVTASSTFEAVAGGVTAYAGVIAGENYKTVSVAEVTYGGILTANGSMTGYSGVAVGINLGSVTKTYVEVSGGRFGAGVSGGIVGNNVNALTTSLIKIVDETFSGSDCAVGYAKAKDDEKVRNVWVYSDRVENVSWKNCISSMIYDVALPVTCPTAAEVKEGVIAFTGEITDLNTSVAYFANVAENGSFAEGTGAAMSNVEYSTVGGQKFVTYKTYDIQAGVAVSRRIADVRVRFVARAGIGSGSELYAFSLAVGSGKYTFSNAEFYLTADFALPEGAFPGIATLENATFDGGHHVVTVSEATLADGVLFLANATEIKNIGLRFTEAGQVGQLIGANGGTLANAVVYLEGSATLGNDGCFAQSGLGQTQNLWVVSRDGTTELSKGSAAYSLIVINGVGTLTQGGTGAMTFTAQSGGDIIFIGYTENGAIFSSDVVFTTGGNVNKKYTAEFISKTLDTDYKLQVLSDVTVLGYTGANETFTVGADLTADALFTAGNFEGTIKGNGHTLTTALTLGSLFGKFGGVIEDLIIDVTLGGTLALFDSENAVTLRNVVILEERAALAVGANVSATNVWFATENQALYAAFLAGTYQNYSLLYKNGDVAFTLGESITATAADSDLQAFAGWYGEYGSVFGRVEREKALALPTSAGNVYLLNYINRTFTCADDLDRLSTAVANGFDFDGVTFRVQDNGFTVDRRLATIGDDTHEFNGNIYGGNKSTIRYANYGVGDTFTVEPFLYRVKGELKELIFEYAVGAVFDGTPALVNENLGKMQGIVVLSKNTALFNGGAGLALVNGGEIKNSWLVTKGDEVAVLAGSLEGVNEMRIDTTTLDVSFSESAQGTRVIFHMSATSGKFLCLYDFDGAVVFPGNYSSGFYTAPATATGNKIDVRSINVITDQDEFVYLGYATSARNLEEGSVIKLGADVEIKRNLKSLRFKGLTLDLNGHYLDLSASTATSEVIFGADSEATTSSGTVKNGAIYFHKDCYGIGVTGLTLQNVVLFMTGDGMMLADYDVVGTVKIVTEDRTRKTELFPRSGSYNYLYAPKAAYVFTESPAEDAAIRATFDMEDNFKIKFVGQENAYYYYGGIDNLSGTEDVAYFAAKNIDTAVKFVDFVNAANISEDNLLGATVTIASDLTVDGTAVSYVNFAGALVGGGYTVTIEGGSFSGAFLRIQESGSADGIALAFKSATVTADKLVTAPDDMEGRVVVVVYQTGVAVQEEDKATAVNVYGVTGEIAVAFGESNFTFTAKESGNYALREWKDMDGNSLGRDLQLTAAGPVKAYFALRYYLSVEYIGVDEELLKKNQNDLPTFNGIGVVFADDVVAGNIPVEVASVGKGFLFKGLTSTDATVTVGANAWTYSVGVSASYDIVLKADLTYIEMIWESVDYKADETTFTGYDDLRSVLVSQGYEVEYKYTALDDTPPLVENKPYHAGSYLVSFRVYSGTGVNRRRVCDASCGLIIKKVTLSFVSVSVSDKVYDGTAVAEKNGEPVLSGFKGDDAAYVTIDGLSFTFADANAGQGKLVYVSGDGTLGYKAAVGAAEKYKYVYRNYDFDAGSVTSGGEIIRASILLRTLVLTIDSVTVEYLAQFDADAPTLTPTVVSGLVEEDRAAFESRASGLVTRATPDCFDVGSYRIFVGNSFAFENYEVRLTPGLEAFYNVTPSEVIVEFDDDDTMVYGEKTHTPKYHVYVGMVGTKKYRPLREGDELLFSEVVYNDGAALLPSSEKYSFTCLFSAENKNYTVKTTDGNYRIVNGNPVAVLSGTNTLTVAPKTLTVTANAQSNTKRFGKRTDNLQAELVAGNSFVEKGAKLVVSREKGEAVGRYLLSYGVKGENGEDLTSRYAFRTQSGEPYYFTITQVAIRIKPTKTYLIYGDTIEMINYGNSVEGGGITIADLYYATNWTASNAPEKNNATLKDIGITVTLSESLRGVLAVGEYDAAFAVDNTNANISEITISGAQKMIVVQKRYLKIKINDISKRYNGSSTVAASEFGYTIDSQEGLLAKDKRSVRIIENGYRIVGQSASVGLYKIDGDFALEGTAANNYYLTYVQGTLTINPVSVSVTAELGYFDEQGAFTTAAVVRNGVPFEDKIYYGDSRAEFKYSLDKDVAFLSVPEEGTEKEISDYIASALKISHYRLNGLIPDYYEEGDIGIVSANNNFNATFHVSFDVEPVRLTIKLLPGTKTIGQPDPEIGYEIIATDPNNGNKPIEDYNEIAKGTFSVEISADRTQGELLGTYSYENIKVDITNLGAGELLTDTSTPSGEAFTDNLQMNTKDVSLQIKQKGFLKTTIGKIVIYGVPLLVLAALVVFLIIFIPRARRKKRANMPDDPTPPDDKNDGGAAGGENDQEGSDESAEEPAAEAEAPATEPEAEKSAEDDMFSAEPPVSSDAPAETAAEDLDFDPSEFDIGPHDEQ